VSGAARPPVLLMEAARLAAVEDGAAAVSLRLEAGELALVLAGDAARAAAVADLACGVEPAAEGAVRFLGQDWARLPPDIADALRGRIGRVFAAGGWLPHLTVPENIMLPLLHHTRTERAALTERAAALACRFGLPGLPLGLPAGLPPADLARAACVRAFLGEAPLLLLEHPLLHGRVPDLMAPLRDALAEARARGAACLWITGSPMVWRDAGLPATHRLVLNDQGLRAARAAA